MFTGQEVRFFVLGAWGDWMAYDTESFASKCGALGFSATAFQVEFRFV